MKTRRYSLINWIYSHSFVESLLWLIGIYLSLGLVFGLTYLLDNFQLVDLVDKNAVTWTDYFYFSFITQTTVGYGDILPVGFGKFLCPLQAVLGFFIFSLTIPLVIVKIWAPGDAIIFAEEAILRTSKDDSGAAKAFFEFRCINTHKMIFADTRVVCFFTRSSPVDSLIGRVNENITLNPDVLPFMGPAAPWYFCVAEKDQEKLYKLLQESEEYEFKILFVGTYGSSYYATVHNYEKARLINGDFVRVPHSLMSVGVGDDFHRVRPVTVTYHGFHQAPKA